MFFLCWNNFHLLEETVTGKGKTYLTHDINIPINKKMFLTYVPQQLEACFAKPKAEPMLSFSSVKFLIKT